MMILPLVVVYHLLLVPFCALCTSDLTYLLFHFVFWLFIHFTNNTTTYLNAVTANLQSHGLILETKQHSLDTLHILAGHN